MNSFEILKECYEGCVSSTFDNGEFKGVAEEYDDFEKVSNFVKNVITSSKYKVYVKYENIDDIEPYTSIIYDDYRIEMQVSNPNMRNDSVTTVEYQLISLYD